METPEQQEQRSRQQLNARALLWGWVIAGAVTYVLPAGGPWMSQESMFAIMGRTMARDIFLASVGHFVLAGIYAWLLAVLIYSLPILGGIFTGIGLGFALYAVNYVIFGATGMFRSNELHVLISHFMFGLFFAVVYKAAAVPPPLGAPTPPTSPASQGDRHRR